MALVFARRITDPLARLLQQLDRALVERKDADLRGWFVLLTNERTVMEQKLDELANRNGIGVLPLTIGDIPAGPPSYKIHRDAEVTVLFYTENKVIANHSFRKSELTDDKVARIMSDLPAILGRK